MTYNHSTSLQYDPLTREVSVKTPKEAVQMNRKKKGIIYARVSTEEQKRKGNGINAQISDCERRAQHQDVEIVSCFKDEAVSGTTLSRK